MKCKICDERHPMREACKLAATVTRTDEIWHVAKPRSRNATTQAAAPEPVQKAVPASGVTAGETEKFDKVAYQREYMRKWRAAKKS